MATYMAKPGVTSIHFSPVKTSDVVDFIEFMDRQLAPDGYAWWTVAWTPVAYEGGQSAFIVIERSGSNAALAADRN